MYMRTCHYNFQGHQNKRSVWLFFSCHVSCVMCLVHENVNVPSKAQNHRPVNPDLCVLPSYEKRKKNGTHFNVHSQCTTTTHTNTMDNMSSACHIIKFIPVLFSKFQNGPQNHPRDVKMLYTRLHIPGRLQLLQHQQFPRAHIQVSDQHVTIVWALLRQRIDDAPVAGHGNGLRWMRN